MLRGVLLALALVLSACASLPVDETAAENDVRRLLNEWAQALPEGRTEDFREVFSTDAGMVWAERGQIQYRSADAIMAGVAQIMAANPDVTTVLSDVRVEIVAEGVAVFSADVVSAIKTDSFAFGFDGIITGVALREGDGWKLFQGHLSEPPRG